MNCGNSLWTISCCLTLRWLQCLSRVKTIPCELSPGPPNPNEMAAK